MEGSKPNWLSETIERTTGRNLYTKKNNYIYKTSDFKHNYVFTLGLSEPRPPAEPVGVVEFQGQH